MRRLVLTGDDYGIDATADAAMIDLLSSGKLTSVSFVVVSPRAAQAAEMLQRAGIGPAQVKLHLCLTSPADQRWQPIASGLTHVVDSDGNLPSLAQVADMSLTADELRRELQAQLDWLAHHGIQPEGLNVHRNVGFGRFGRTALAWLLDFAADQCLTFRLPRQPALPMDQQPTTELRHMFNQSIELADSFTVAIPDAVVEAPLEGIDGYDDVLSFYLQGLAALPDSSTSEIVFRPGVIPGDKTGRWHLQVADDPIFRDALTTFWLTNSWAPIRHHEPRG